MVLVGDAAGLINPLNGEGIQYALLSRPVGRPHVVAQAIRHERSARLALAEPLRAAGR